MSTKRPSHAPEAAASGTGLVVDGAKNGLPAHLAEAAAGIIEGHYLTKVARRCERKPAAFPHVTEGGRWVLTPDGLWTGGFWVGQLWLLWKVTKEKLFRSAAEGYLALLEPRKDAEEIDFDLGFLYAYGFALGFGFTGRDEYRRVALEAADRLLGLAHPEAGLIYHIYPERVSRYGLGTATSIIDVMMNLTLLWWAYEETGSGLYRDAALGHARRSAEWLVRSDGSTAQVVDFDRKSGKLIRTDTHQGLSPGSCWSRGQAWAIYGFLQAYHHTRERAFLEVLESLVRYWSSNLAADGVPPWDFEAPADSRDVRDTSAAAIVLAALVRARRWGLLLPGAQRLMERTWRGLTESLAASQEEGILGGGCFHYPRREGVGAATVWGDYYLLEALVGFMMDGKDSHA